MKMLIKTVLAVGSLVTALITHPAAAQVSGAIWTSLADGGEVNANIYNAKEDVYLNGGPGMGAGSNSPGLPDGIWVFMVTDPSGQTLLSQDAAECRQVEVTGGVFSGAVGPCPHTEGGAIVGVPVQLMPYADTPNNGGEYKVWLTPLDEYVCPLADVSCDGGNFGFINSESKTDNFKVNSVADEIDTRFFDPQGNFLDGRMITWFDTVGASNNKFSYEDLSHDIHHEAHVESPEVGKHYVSIQNQPGCTVGAVFVGGVQTHTIGPQTVKVNVTTGMKKKGTFTVFVDVYCTN
jgi:hypothetical protein